MIRARLLTGTLLPAIIVSSACGAAPVASGPPQATPGASVWLTAIEKTKSLGTARIEVTLASGDAGTALTGTGIVDLAKGLGFMTWTDSSGSRLELDNERGTFVKTDHWRAQSTATKPLADPLAELGSLHIDAATSTPCGQNTCTRYRGTLPATSASLAALAYPADAVRPSQVLVTVDIDSRARIVAVQRQAGGSTLRVSLQDFSVPLDLSAPTRSE